MKNNRFKQTVAAFIAAMSMVAAPQQAKAAESQVGGGLDFNHVRMMDKPNPIYIPYYHPKQTYRAQVRKANKRRK